MNKSLDIDIAWGGYYSSLAEDSNEINIFRLLDFNQDAYHVALYKEKFESIPTENEVRSLSPFIGHVPIDVRGLLNRKNVKLIGSSPLIKEDLEGYIYYLEEFGVSDQEAEDLVTSVISFSNQKPLPLRLLIVDGEFEIQERE